MGTVWELDFYSRPIVDERQKKLWEVLICEGLQDTETDPETLFRYSKYLSNTEVNSVHLKDAISEALAQAPNPPTRVRFFRYQMQNMIARACEELGLPVKTSRRMLALQTWLDERKQTVYPEHPGYVETSSPTIMPPQPTPRPLPDALLGQQWTLVSLEVAALGEMSEWGMDFGEAFPLSLTGLAPDAKVPGVLIFSPRAMPLAGWMSGLELSAVTLEPASPPRLLLETGAVDSWILATLNTPALRKEAEGFIAAKQAANNVHFLAVQSDPKAQSFAGFWLLQDLVLG